MVSMVFLMLAAAAAVAAAGFAIAQVAAWRRPPVAGQPEWGFFALLWLAAGVAFVIVALSAFDPRMMQ